MQKKGGVGIHIYKWAICCKHFKHITCSSKRLRVKSQGQKVSVPPPTTPTPFAIKGGGGSILINKSAVCCMYYKDLIILKVQDLKVKVNPHPLKKNGEGVLFFFMLVKLMNLFGLIGSADFMFTFMILVVYR